MRNRRRLGLYQMPDAANPLSWGAVRENMEEESNRDFLKLSKNLNPGPRPRQTRAGSGAKPWSNPFSAVQRMFMRRPSISSDDTTYSEGSGNMSYRPGSTRANQIERPGFLQGLNDAWFS